MIIHYILKTTNLLTVLGIRKNCHSSRKNILLDVLIKNCGGGRGVGSSVHGNEILSSIKGGEFLN
jgi:hypothetical protein